MGIRTYGPNAVDWEERVDFDRLRTQRLTRLTAGSFPGVEFLRVTYQPGACSSHEGGFMRHAGQEFGYLLAGRLQVDVGFDSYRLGPGDSISFPATTPHRLRNDGPGPAHAIWCILGRHTSVQ